MPNTFVKPSVVARTALGLLQREIILPRLVWRDHEREFAGKIGDTVNVRIPAPAVTARKFDRTGVAGDATVVTTNVAESSIPVKLDTHLYNAVPVTDEELTLQVEDFGAQILAPQVRGVAEGAENLVAAVLDAQAASVVLSTTAPEDTLTDVAVTLDQRSVPRSGRVLVISPDMQGYFLKSQEIKKREDTTGTDALVDATLGRLRGFTIVVSNALKPKSAHAFVREAVAFVTKAPAAPAGASFAASESYAGLAMRWLRDYDADTLQDRSIVSAYAGVKLTSTDRIVSIAGPAS